VSRTHVSMSQTNSHADVIKSTRAIPSVVDDSKIASYIISTKFNSEVQANE
jgi:hypothetical protein